MTRCKYCRVEVGPANTNDFLSRNEVERQRCFDAYACRDRMLDRERRIVQVFWRIKDRLGPVDITNRPQAFRFADGRKVRRVTVRRRAKP